MLTEKNMKHRRLTCVSLLGAPAAMLLFVPAGVFFCVWVYAVTSVFACPSVLAVANRRGKSHLFYTLTMFHKISVKKVTKSFQLDVTNGEKSSIIILKCTILYKISEISNWRQINQSKMR